MKSPYSHNNPHKVLAQTGQNEIVYCYECKIYHIHYETLSVDLTLKGLFSLMEDLDIYIKENIGQYPDNKRWIEVITPSDNIRFYFSINDCNTLALMIVACIKAIRNQPRSSEWN